MATDLKSLVDIREPFEDLGFSEEEKERAMSILKQCDGLGIKHARSLLKQCSDLLLYVLVEF